MDCSCLGCVCVQEKHVGIVEFCGKYMRSADPGLQLVLPCCESVKIMNMKVQQLQFFCETKTADNVFVKVHVAVQYQVLPGKEADALYKLTDPSTQIRSYVFDGIRSSIPKLDLDSAFASKNEIAHSVEQALMNSMTEFGYRIIHVLIIDLDPDRCVKDAMNEINAQSRLREANAYKADSEKILLVKAAEAESETKYLLGTGVARQRKAIVDGLRSTVHEFSTAVHGISNKDVMDLLLMTQYFDTLKDSAHYAKAPGSGNTLFLPHGPKSVEKLRCDMKHMFQNNVANTAL